MDSDDTNPPEEPAEAPGPTEAEVMALCESLAEALLSPNYGEMTLRRQANLLDRLLYKFAEDNIDKGRFATDWIPLALKVQKQCVDTLKAAQAIEYMQKLNAPRPVQYSLPPPHPLENEKRTDEA